MVVRMRMALRMQNYSYVDETLANIGGNSEFRYGNDHDGGYDLRANSGGYGRMFPVRILLSVFFFSAANSINMGLP